MTEIIEGLGAAAFILWPFVLIALILGAISLLLKFNPSNRKRKP